MCDGGPKLCRIRGHFPSRRSRCPQVGSCKGGRFQGKNFPAPPRELLLRTASEFPLDPGQWFFLGKLILSFINQKSIPRKSNRLGGGNPTNHAVGGAGLGAEQAQVFGRDQGAGPSCNVQSNGPLGRTIGKRASGADIVNLE